MRRKLLLHDGHGGRRAALAILLLAAGSGVRSPALAGETERLDPALVEHIVSQADDTQRGEAQRLAQVARQGMLTATLPWLSAVGTGWYAGGVAAWRWPLAGAVARSAAGFPYASPYPYLSAVEQPVGHRIVSAGPKGYVYEPVYAARALPEPALPAVVPAGAGEPPRATLPSDQSEPRRLSTAERRVLGEAVDAFRRQQYERALEHLERITFAEKPHYPAELLRAQALFALGEYEGASASLRQALAGLPESDWGLIVANYREYYLLDAPFTAQLRRLEKYAAQHPESAAAALLLGFQYGYLGYPAAAAAQLERAVELAPEDRLAARLAARFAALARRQQGARGDAQQPADPPKPRHGPRAF